MDGAGEVTHTQCNRAAVDPWRGVAEDIRVSVQGAGLGVKMKCDPHLDLAPVRAQVDARKRSGSICHGN